MNYYLSVLKKYAVFSGRARRAEYWYFFLFNSIVLVLLMIVASVLGVESDEGESVFTYVYQLAVMIPSIAVSIRRMHDVNKSGWFILIPVYNLILTFRKGSEGENKYGPNPIKLETK